MDIAIVGAGAAGLMAGIWAGRTLRSASPRPSVVLLDGARTLGAKILVAGGGRCNVTHDQVDEKAYSGSSPNAIRKVLRRFDVPQTVQFFREIGVELKREETGKLFPTTDLARTVLDALLRAAAAADVRIQHPWRVRAVRSDNGAFVIEADGGGDDRPPTTLRARRVILATGGRSLPKTGSDGQGYQIVRSLGHTLTPRIFPGLVPLTLPKDHFVCSLSGITLPAALEVRSGSSKRLVRFADSTLCTHFGLSGPSVLDISRHYLDAKAGDPQARLVVNWLPGESVESVDQGLRALGRTAPASWLRQRLPERLAEALCAESGVAPSTPGDQLTREQRRSLAAAVAETVLPITGDRGFAHAEVTAGGVPLSELRLETMESRVCPGLYLCGEICDVDGRIGGFNFQWAWASGYVAGLGAAGLAHGSDAHIRKHGNQQHRHNDPPGP